MAGNESAGIEQNHTRERGENVIIAKRWQPVGSTAKTSVEVNHEIKKEARTIDPSSVCSELQI